MKNIIPTLPTLLLNHSGLMSEVDHEAINKHDNDKIFQSFVGEKTVVKVVIIALSEIKKEHYVAIESAGRKAITDYLSSLK